MVLSEDTLSKKHLDLCNKLNLDVDTIKESWHCFRSVNEKFSLEGDPLHWIGCSIYVACRRTCTPTIEHSVLQGNCVNLTSLLRHCDLSLAQFFFNIKKWCEMVQHTDQFRCNIDELEKTFAVTYNVFREYYPIYVKVFKAPEPLRHDGGKQCRNRKQKPLPCPSTRIFEFCWIVFILNKLRDSNYGNNLVNSLHLLLTICDWAFRNAYVSHRKDLLNPNFEGLPSDWSTLPCDANADKAPCILNLLCKNDQAVTDALYIKEYPFKSFLKELYEKGILHGSDEYMDIFDPSVFESNFKNVSSAYEVQLLSDGSFDERIFLAELRRRLLRKEQLTSQVWSPALDRENPLRTEYNKAQIGANQRLFEENDYLASEYKSSSIAGNKNSSPFCMTTSANVVKLHKLLGGCNPMASEALEQLFSACNKNPSTIVESVISRLSEKFLTAYTCSNENESPADINNVENGARRIHLATILFYKFVENILQHERTITQDISLIIEKSLFYECVFACSLEIVIFSYNEQKPFPWILHALDMQPYDFVKVIELIIRSKEQLTREIIKYLSMIEEMIISSLVWRSDSSIWKTMEKNVNFEIPKFEDIALFPPSTSAETSKVATTCNTTQPKLPTNHQLASPSPSATDRFQSPLPTTINRQLFTNTQTSPIQKHTHILVKDFTGVTKLIALLDHDSKISTTATQPSTAGNDSTSVVNVAVSNQGTGVLPMNKPTRRVGGVAILFRKFYNLAGERLERLCTDLGITNTELKQKIWTVFEESIVSHYKELLKDRDLDQLLMCAVYVICKISDAQYQRSFADIMKSYREQPQAYSDIYRNVLLKRGRVSSSRNEDKSVRNTTQMDEERGDLIKFYNTIYVQMMKGFAVKFANAATPQQPSGKDTPGAASSSIPLSPLPASRRQIISPSVQISKNLILKSLESSPNTPLFGSGRNYNYIFSRSPSKDLRDINRAIKCNVANGKRQLQLSGEGLELPNSKRMVRKVNSLMEERRNQAGE